MSQVSVRARTAVAAGRRAVPWLLGAAAVPTVIRLVGDHATPVGILLTAVLPLTVPVLFVLTALAWLLRSRNTAIAGVVALLLNAIWLAPLWISDDPPRSGQRIVAMTLNMRYGLAAPSKIIEQVRDKKVDLLALEELTPEAVITLQADGLNAILPYRALSPGDHAHGSGLWSRWPLTRGPDWDGVHHMPGATVKIGDRDVVVRVAHPMRTRRFNADDYRRDYGILTGNARALDPATPSIIMGDFNAGRDQKAFRTLMGDRWRDAPEYAGSGFTPTWNWWTFLPPVLSLDHILISHQFGASRTDTFRAPGSDHHGLVAWLVLTPA
jgi:endonuclease/exonuclease/phosphatase family metal-dependent hydrolase